MIIDIGENTWAQICERREPEKSVRESIVLPFAGRLLTEAPHLFTLIGHISDVMTRDLLSVRAGHGGRRTKDEIQASMAGAMMIILYLVETELENRDLDKLLGRTNGSDGFGLQSQ